MFGLTSFLQLGAVATFYPASWELIREEDT